MTATARPSNCPLRGDQEAGVQRAHKGEGGTESTGINLSTPMESGRTALQGVVFRKGCKCSVSTHRKTKVPPAPRPSTSLVLKEIFPTMVSCSTRREEGASQGACAVAHSRPPLPPLHSHLTQSRSNRFSHFHAQPEAVIAGRSQVLVPLVLPLAFPEFLDK